LESIFAKLSWLLEKLDLINNALKEESQSVLLDNHVKRIRSRQTDNLRLNKFNDTDLRCENV
jgi:hypothetical protein